MRPQNDWQVEKFDIRDYVSVVVSGILSKSRRLDKLQVRARYLDTRPRPEKALADFRLLIGPLKRLRCVKKPLLMGVFQHEAFVNRYCQHRHPHGHSLSNCIPPPSSDPVPIVAPGGFDFDNIATPWEETLALEAPTNIIPPSPLTQLFVRFKEFHDKLANAMPHIVRRYEVHRAMWRMMDADTYPGGRGAALQDIVENSSDPIKQWKLRAPTMTQET
ncbi:hypothetical protein N0V91_002493 [Didymella pomorum]|uniref:Uncharacterized protein n=1 Tax=Didymella pomorum TaxID=749634 RepID=A0A9W9DB90_9PLEO|nr:hypothetical protein N0V91_002493 [Didymella pomorum]